MWPSDSHGSDLPLPDPAPYQTSDNGQRDHPREPPPPIACGGPILEGNHREIVCWSAPLDIYLHVDRCIGIPRRRNLNAERWLIPGRFSAFVPARDHPHVTNQSLRHACGRVHAITVSNMHQANAPTQVHRLTRLRKGTTHTYPDADTGQYRIPPLTEV